MRRATCRIAESGSSWAALPIAWPARASRSTKRANTATVLRAVRAFSGHSSIETVLRYDDNRRDMGGEVAGKVMQRLARVLAVA